MRDRFRSAALGGNRPNPYGATDPHRLARSAIQRRDGMRFFERKAAGGMALEEAARRRLDRRRYAAADDLDELPERRAASARAVGVEHAATTRRSSNSARGARRAPAAPMGDARAGSSPRARIAAAKRAGRAERDSRPVTPSSTTWRQPRTSVATTGRPLAAASIAARGKPSRCDGRTNTSAPRYSVVDVVAQAEEPHAGPLRLGHRGPGQGVGLVRVVAGPTHTTV